MDYNYYNQPYQQSLNLACINIVLGISFFYNLAICIACFIIKFIFIIIIPISFHLFSEIIIFFGIILKSYNTFIIGVVICFTSGIYELHFILLLLIFSSAYSVDTDGSIIFIIVLILTAILIIIECSVYGYYTRKIKNHFNPNLGGIIYPVQNINGQPIYPAFQNIGNQDIATPILSPQENQAIIYVNNQYAQNIDNQGSGLNIPPPAQNIENQGSGLNIPPSAQNIDNQGTGLNIPPPEQNIDTQVKN